MTDTIADLAQKLYSDDGYSGNIYKKASVEMLRYYEYKAQEIIEACPICGCDLETWREMGLGEHLHFEGKKELKYA